MENILKQGRRILAAAVVTALGLGFATGGITDKAPERQMSARYGKAYSDYSRTSAGNYRVNRHLVACPASKYWMVINGAAQPGVVRPS